MRVRLWGLRTSDPFFIEYRAIRLLALLIINNKKRCRTRGVGVAITDSAYDGSEQELIQVLSFLGDAYGSFHSLRNWSLTRMGDWKFGGNSRFLRTDPGFFSRNLHIWRDRTKVLGIVVSENGNEARLQIGQDQRILEERMLIWSENVWGKDKDRIVIPVFADDEWRKNLLKKRGYRMAGSCGSLRRYDTTLSPHRTPLEKGFTLSDLERSKDADGFINLMVKASGKPFIDKEWYESRSKAPGYRPNMIVQVFAPDGVCVSCAEARIDWKQNYSEIDPIAVHPDYQDRGLDKACLAECFRRLADMKVREAYIMSEIEPAPSNLPYDSMLPVGKVEEFSWELTR
jgi:ribosomal protein S18 acetylase RimI-like enzyme